MTDHLADAHACATSALRSPSVATAVSWLTATCEHVLDHLEAQNTPQEATSADLTAPQDEAGQLGRDHPANGYTPTTDDVETWYVGNHDPAHAHEFRRWLAAHDAEVAAQAWDEGHRASEREYECMFSGHPGTEEGEMCDECMGWTNPYHADRTERGE